MTQFEQAHLTTTIVPSKRCKNHDVCMLGYWISSHRDCVLCARGGGREENMAEIIAQMEKLKAYVFNLL